MNQFSKQLWNMYKNVGLFSRLITSLRPIICPIEGIQEVTGSYRKLQEVTGSYNKLQKVTTSYRKLQQVTVLDVGCGNGMLITTIVSNKFCDSGVGVDISEKALSVARSVAKQHSLPISFAPSIPSEKFDVVLLVDVLHHVPKNEQSDFFVRASKCVKPGGLLIIKEMTTVSKWRMWLNALHDLVLARQWISEIPIENIEKWASDQGLKLEQSNDYSVLCYGHRLRVFRNEKC